MRFNNNHSLDRLLEFEQPLENQLIHIDPTREETLHLHLICRLAHVERHAQIIWSYNNSHKLPFAQFNTSFDGKVARLSAKDLKPEYSGSYACEIRLPCGASTAYTQCEVIILRRPQYAFPFLSTKNPAVIEQKVKNPRLLEVVDVSMLLREYIELRTLSDVPGLPEDEQLEEVDVACECSRRTQSRNCGCTWRSRASPPYPLSSFAEPRVIFINTAPQSDMVCPRCCCACHRSHCMYIGAESYPLHATVKPPPNCRPDASWTSGPGKYLPKDTEVQSPEAAAAARATIERVLESRMYDSVFGKSLDTTENKKVSKRAPTFPVSDPKATKNKISKEAIPGSNEDSSSSLVRAAMSVDGGEAAKERFLNALARFQIGTAPKPECNVARPQNGMCKPNGSQECMAVGHKAIEQTKISSASAVSELGPVVQHPESLTLQHPTRGSGQSRWQQQRNKIFRNVRRIRSPSTSKRFSRREERDRNEAICYPEENEDATVESKNPPTFLPNEIHTATNTSQFSDESTDPVAFLNEHFRKYKIAPLTLLEMKNLLLRFVQLNTHEYHKYGVEVTNFSTSWADGVAMCALLHHFFPNSFDFNTVLSGGKAENYRLAFKLAAEMAGVPNFIAIEEVTRSETGPDWRRIFLYLSHVLVALEDHPLNRARPFQLIRTN
ncbi:unnamed protein product [Taenia asiatica]|uniref:Ig-like domain-containing protein n=1 Tax=Taenia asiatica TaxID=60517 RepID=A0A158R6M0_TAEAS|nr:unnamed protein product [Taenia asiatica]